jgi:hypothetical protein
MSFSNNLIKKNEYSNLDGAIIKNFNITNDKYFLDTMYDGFGLYSIIDWTNSKRKTFIEKNNNVNKTKKKIYIVNNTNNYGNSKKYKKNKNNSNSNRLDYKENSIVSSSITNSEYMYIDSLNKCGMRMPPDYKKCKEPSFRCVILKNVKSNDYLVLLRYGIPSNFYDKDNEKKIIACCEFIKANTNNDNKIMLFGMSMGGSMAQHIALKLASPNIYIVSLCIGNTLNEADLNSFKTQYNGRFISLALGYYDNEILHIDEYLRQLMYKDKFSTIPTLILALEYFNSIENYGPVSSLLYINDSSEFNKINENVYGKKIHNFKLLYNVLLKLLSV